MPTFSEGKAMRSISLVKDPKKYSGKYVATKTFRDKRVISSGSDPVKVFNDAKKQGVEEPVIFYVPKKDMAYIL